MKVIISALVGILAVSIASGVPLDTNVDSKLATESKIHVFLLMVPDSAVQALKKARQEEAVEAGAEITETGAYVGQIISGVLGGDVRPIFAGSASFIDEPDVQQGVSTILANVAPSLNMYLKMWYGRVQTALGFTSTVRPGLNGTLPQGGQQQQINPNQAPSNGALQGPQPGQPGGVPLQGQSQQTQQQQQQQLQQLSSQEQLEGEKQNGVFTSGDHLYVSTTVEPLPFLKLTANEDDDDENDNIHKQKFQ